MIKKLLAGLFALACLVSWTMGAIAAPEWLHVQNAWIQQSPPGVPVMAGYLTLDNEGSDTVRITGVQSPAAERIEIHRTDITGNTATMSHIKELPVPARSKVTFSPGGYHLMIFGVKQPLKAGDRLPIEILHTSGDTIKIDAVVRGEDSHDSIHEGH